MISTWMCNNFIAPLNIASYFLMWVLQIKRHNFFPYTLNSHTVPSSIASFFYTGLLEYKLDIQSKKWQHALIFLSSFLFSKLTFLLIKASYVVYCLRFIDYTIRLTMILWSLSRNAMSDTIAGKHSLLISFLSM